MKLVNHVRLILAVVCLALPSVAAADKIKVAVVPGIAVNLDAARVDALSQDLADALMTELDIEAVGGLEVRRQLPADGIPPDCVATPACFSDVAQRVGASQLLFVVMVDTGTGGAIQIDSTWVEPSTGKSTSRPAIDIASLADAKSRFLTSARVLLPDAPVRPKPKVAPAQIGTMSDEVPRHFTTPAKVTAAVALIGLGVGIGFGIKARSLYDDCDAMRNTCLEDERDSIRNVALVADVGYVVALGATVATAVMFMTSGKESQLIVAPAAEGGATVGFAGRF